MDALTRTPLSQQAATALLDEISRGRWTVGEQMPGEVALATELKVSRSTIREAIRQLAARGVVTSRQGIGVFVTSVRPTGAWDRLTQIATITDLIQVRVAIESRAAALAAAAHDDDDATNIRRALSERNNSVAGATAAELATSDIRFHHEVVTAAHNAPLLSLFDSLEPRLITTMTELLELTPVGKQDADDHACVVDAILARDCDLAETLTREHLLGLAQALLEAKT